ncbi:MAG: type II toxin-antitoxin system HipA family toxin [Candidatus Obscuribacterales bacterium]|nr:type II toxin-antitoxin system HipA family toxin [Candidatus Obscuribacterales bacterium]
MKKLKVIYMGWGERFELGILADDGTDLLFEYTPEALKRGLELSPIKLPLSDKSYGDFPQHQHRLPGLVSDCLPDGWGMLLMDRLFRRQRRTPAEISPLDRLAFIGSNAMGALVFEPAHTDALTPADVELLDLARDVREVLADESEGLLRKLVLMGGSPHGARPKVLVNFDREKNRMSNLEFREGTPMLVKFPAQHEHKEVCAVEALYGLLAKACGLRAPEVEFFDLSEDLSAFGIERFDRSNGLRIPMHTAAGAMHVDFRIPQLDYISLLRLTQIMTRDAREVLHAFERCTFNVIFNNRDDHSKNFSFLLGRDDRWQFSPAYDLSFSNGPNGEHQMDICGEARSPARDHLIELAKKTGIPIKTAVQSIERIAIVAEQINDFVDQLPIRPETMDLIGKAVILNRSRVMNSSG